MLFNTELKEYVFLNILTQNALSKMYRLLPLERRLRYLPLFFGKPSKNIINIIALREGWGNIHEKINLR